MRYIVQKDITLLAADGSRRSLVAYTKSGFTGFAKWRWTLSTRFKQEELGKIPHMAGKRTGDFFIGQEQVLIETRVFRIVWFFWLEYDGEETFKITNPEFLQTFNGMDMI